MNKKYLISTLLFVALLMPSFVSAQEPGVWLPRDAAADLAGIASEAVLKDQKIAALEQEVLLLKRINETQERLVALHEQIAAGETKLRELAEGERDIYKAKAARGSGKLKGAWAGAATGALIGSGVMPGIGTGAGAVLGGILGLFIP